MAISSRGATQSEEARPNQSHSQGTRLGNNLARGCGEDSVELVRKSDRRSLTVLSAAAEIGSEVSAKFALASPPVLADVYAEKTEIAVTRSKVLARA